MSDRDTTNQKSMSQSRMRQFGSIAGLFFKIHLYKHVKDQINTSNLKQGCCVHQTGIDNFKLVPGEFVFFKL